MLTKEMLINTSWTSAEAKRVEILRSLPAMCGSAFTGAHRHHHLDRLDHLVVHLDQADFGDATGMVELPRGDWWICPPTYCHTINHMFRFGMRMAWFSLHARREKGSCV